MKKINILLIIWLIIITCVQKSSAQYDTKYELLLSLDKFEYLEGEEINLKFEFNFNKTNSIIYYTPWTSVYSLIKIVDEQGNVYKFKNYLKTLDHIDTVNGVIYTTNGRYVFPYDSILPNENKILTTEINKDFANEDSYYSEDLRVTKFLPIGFYSFKFNHEVNHYYWLKGNVYINDLSFKVLPKN